MHQTSSCFGHLILFLAFNPRDLYYRGYNNNNNNNRHSVTSAGALRVCAIGRCCYGSPPADWKLLDCFELLASGDVDALNVFTLCVSTVIIEVLRVFRCRCVRSGPPSDACLLVAVIQSGHCLRKR